MGAGKRFVVAEMIIYKHKNKPENILLDSANEDVILDWITQKHASCNEAFIKFGELSLNALKMFIKESINMARTAFCIFVMFFE